MTRPGPLYPDRCLDCPEMLDEDYGCVKGQPCIYCQTEGVKRVYEDAEGVVDAKSRPNR